ncbi:hypothetical protein JCM19046_3432 [Bacillus sp. JCM 19046]|nr:hypothetical protein JCM19045_3076 [Bacillus sp. JCM 19045]GAF18827.1 hypothetical protein JCM19046_3432 [Bacillus sp. JCM 19046]
MLLSINLFPLNSLLVLFNGKKHQERVKGDRQTKRRTFPKLKTFVVCFILTFAERESEDYGVVVFHGRG